MQMEACTDIHSSFHFNDNHHTCSTTFWHCLHGSYANTFLFFFLNFYFHFLSFSQWTCPLYYRIFKNLWDIKIFPRVNPVESWLAFPIHKSLKLAFFPTTWPKLFQRVNVNLSIEMMNKWLFFFLKKKFILVFITRIGRVQTHADLPLGWGGSGSREGGWDKCSRFSSCDPRSTVQGWWAE